VGTRILNDFPDGVWFIALDALSDPSLVPQTVAAVFDLHEAPGRATLDALARMLRSKTALLILDNCEHVLDACASLALRLLTECPALKILATSREVLHVAGGATYQMPPLSVPYADQASVEQLMQYEAVRLFTERASLARSSFALTDENLQVVIEMCRRLDGIPLAIELAAAQVQVLEPSEVLAQLDTCLELLSTPDTGVSSRHRTLLGSLAWSWGMLVADEQRFMRRLSVFAGGWTLDAAEAVSQENALDLTRALVEKSLLVLDRPLGSRTRYRFHEMVRQYAHDRLLEAGEVEMVRERHLAFFLQLSEQIEAELHGPQETDWLSLADEVRDNLRLALEQASRTDTQAGLYIAGRLQGFWETFSVPEGRRWLEEFLAKPDAREFPHARGKAMYALGMLRIWTQDYAGAASAAQESLAHFRLCGDRSGQVDALLLYGHALQFIDRHVVADEQYTEALELARTDGDARRQAMALFRLGYGRRDLQLEYWETAVDLFLQARDLNSAASLLYATARFRILLTGDLARAKKDLEEAARLGPLRGRNIGGLWEEPAFAKSLVALMQCDFEGAAAPLEAIVTLANELGNRMGYFWARVQLGYVRLRAGDLLEARGIFAETARNFQQDGSTIGVAYSLEGVAALALAVGKPAQAARLLGWADAAREHIGDPRPYLEQANVDRVLAACRASLGEAEFFAAYQEGQGWNLEDAVVAAFAGG
jgi:predicted ATPase